MSYANNQLFDVAGRTQSPYIEDTVFVVSPVVNKFPNGNRSFILTADRIVQNIGSFQNISIDFGNGFQTLTLGTPINITLSAGMNRPIVRVQTSDGRFLYCRFEVEIAQSNNLPEGGPDEEYSRANSSPETLETADIAYLGGLGTAKVKIFFACPDKKLRKPLLVLDGFNADAFIDDVNVDSFFQFFNNFSNTPNVVQGTSRRLTRDLRREGYDLIFVNWASENGRDYMQRYAFLLQKILANVNAEKAQNGSTEKNVIIGLSMGGVIAKWALLDLENRNPNAQNGGHDVKQFFAYDSPLQGANIPLGIQYLTKDFGENILGGIGGRFVPTLRGAILRLTSPAARQLLTYQAFTANPRSPAEHVAFYNELNSMGTIQKCEFLTVSNGSLLGVLNFPAGKFLFGGYNNFTGRFRMALFLEVRALPNRSNNPENIYKREVRYPWPIPSWKGTISVKDFRALDGAPGGTTGLTQDLNDAIPGMKGATYDDGPDFIRSTFVPTVSALDIRNPERDNPFFNVSDPQQLISSLQTRSIGILGSRSDAQADVAASISGSVNRIPNQAHVSLSLRTTGFLLYHMITKNTLQNGNPTELNNRTFNWGKNNALLYPQTAPQIGNFQPREFSDILDYRLNISNSGKLWVNRNGGLGFTDIANSPLNSTNSNYVLLLQKSNGCEQSNGEIFVSNGGELHLGDAAVNNTANVIIKKGSTVHIQATGKLIIENNAQLTIDSAGRLIIDAGAFISFGSLTSRILVKKGGELIINGSPVITGSGHFYFEKDNIYTQNDNVVLEGTGKEIPLFKIGSQASVKHSTNFELKFKRCAVIKEGTANQPYLQCRNSASISADNVLFKAIQSGSSLYKSNFIQTYNVNDAQTNYTDKDFEFRNCTFKDAGTIFRLEDTRDKNLSTYFVNRDFGPIGVEFWSCNFENTGTAIIADRSRRIEFAHCNLNGCGIVAEATWFLFVRNTKIRGVASAIKTHDVGYLWVADGTVIDGGEQGGGQGAGIGINTKPDIRPSFVWNLLLMNDVTIQRCSIGVKLHGWVGATMGPNNVVNTGLLQMDCANMIDNGVAIDAYDAIFSIYGRYSSNNTNTQVGSNQFRRDSLMLVDFPTDTQRFIKSVFDAREYPILDPFLNFSGNYWDGIPASALNVPVYLQLLNKPGPQNYFEPWAGNLILNNTITEFDALKCGSISLRNETVDTTWRTIVNVNGVLRDILVQQRAGYREIDRYDVESAVALLRPVAHLATTITDTANAQVKHLVEVARALALETPNSTGRADKGTAADGWVEASFMGYANPITEMNIRVSPNPAQNTFKLELPEGEFTVSVFDAVGSRVYQKAISFEPTLDIDVTKWQNALYLVEVVNTQTKEKTVRKIVVQH
jgi:hypothetical protein